MSPDPEARAAAWESLPPPTPNLRIYDRPEKKQLVLEVGPIDLPAHASHHSVQQFPLQIGYLPFDFTMHGFVVEVVDANGDSVPRVVLHHIDTTRLLHRGLFLPVAQRFAAAGSDTPNTYVPPWLFGVPLSEGEPLLVTAMFHNPTDVPLRGVRARLAFRYSHEKPLYEIHPFLLDVMPSGGRKYFDLPPGRSEWTWEGSPAVPGGLLGIGGHIHRYAERLELTDVTAGKVIWRANIVRDGPDDVKRVPVDYSPRGATYAIYPDHTYRITAVYVNPTRHTIEEGGMAKIAGGFVLARGVEWPQVDPLDPVYQADLRYVLRNRCADAALTRN